MGHRRSFSGPFTTNASAVFSARAAMPSPGLPTLKSFGEPCLMTSNCGLQRTEHDLLEDVQIDEKYCTIESCTNRTNPCPDGFSCFEQGDASGSDTVCAKDISPPASSPSPDPDPGPHSNPKPSPEPSDNDCVAWRQTGGCDPFGPREAHADDLNCRSFIAKGRSGCECANGVTAAQVGCDHEPFTCADACDSSSSEPLKPSKVDAGGCGPACDMLVDAIDTPT